MTAELLELAIDERLDQSHRLELELPAASRKAALLVPDGELRHRTVDYVITELEDERRGAATTIRVEAEALWYRLGDITYVGSLTLTDQTIAEGAAAIIAPATGWSIDTARSSTSATTYSLEEQDQTVLALLRTWAKVTNTFLEFDTIARTIAFVDTRGRDLGLAFRYRRNLRNVRRRARPPAVTVLYPYGADGLTIAGVNGGTPYLEDFTFYTDQGLTLSDARARFTRSRVWSDTSFLRDTELLVAAQAKLDELAQAVVTYELDVVDLTELTQHDDAVRVGDTCRVADPAFARDLRTTVVRTRTYPKQPHRNRVELAYLHRPAGSTSSSSSRPSTSDAWVQFVGPVGADYQVRNDGTYLTNRIPLRFRAGGRADFHLELWATGVGAGTMHVTIEDASNAGEQQWRTLDVPYTDGELVRAFASWATEELEGQKDYRVRVTTTADGGAAPSAGVDIAADSLNPAEASFWIKAQGATRQTPTAANSQTFEYTGAVQQFTIPDNVTALTITTRGGQGGGAKGGNGGEVTAKFTGLTPGAVLDVYVGGQGAYNSPSGIGWPNGGATPETAAGDVAGGAGGGSSDVRPEGTTIADALLVAAGGGGSSRTGPSRGADQAQGGPGGFYAGTAGWGLTPTQTEGVARAGGGATQFAGGAAGASGGNAGTFGQGGNAASTSNSFHFAGGAGGGGWYGGGGAGSPTIFGGGSYAGDGGGGSGWVRADGFDLSATDGSRSGNGQVVIEWDDPL